MAGMFDTDNEVIAVAEGTGPILEDTSVPEVPTKTRREKRRKAKSDYDGISYSDLWKELGEDAGKRHRFRVRDPYTKRYMSETYADYEEGLAWAKQQRRKFLTGDASAADKGWRKLADEYIEVLVAMPAAKKHIQQVRRVADSVHALGARDIGDEGFPKLVHRWLLNLKCYRTARWRDRKNGPESFPPASASTKDKFWNIAKAICKQAVQSGAMRYNPLAALKLPTVPEVHKEVFIVPELKMLVRPEMEKDPWFMTAALGAYTGQRQTILRNMELSWFNFHTMYCTVPATCPGNKAKRTFRFPIQPELQQVIQLFTRKHRKHVGALSGILKGGRHIPKMTESSAGRGFQRYCERAGVQAKGRGLHAFRHTVAAMLTAMGLNSNLVMSYVDHSTPSTSRHYSKNADIMRADVRSWSEHAFKLRVDAVAAADH